MRVGYDVDGVIAAFAEYFLNYFGFDETLAECWDDPRYRDNFHRTYDNREFWVGIPLLVKPEDIPESIKPSCYITARPIPNEWSMEWLWKNGFPHAPLFTVGENGSKSELVEKYCDVFLDDGIHNYEELTKDNLKCILMTRSHNKNYVTDRRCDTVQQVPQKIKELW